MQKKDHSPESGSVWENSLKKQQQRENFKKFAFWGGAIILTLLGLAGLVAMTQSSSSSTTVVESQNLPPVKETDIVVGDKNAKVTITEYADFQCPACASYNLVINKILSDYKGKVKLVYRFFPLRNIHQNALISSQASYAAHKMGKFSEMKDLLYNKQQDWESVSDPRSIFVEYATSINLDGDKFSQIMNSDEAKNAVLDGEKESLGLGLNSTPTFFIGNKKITAQGYEGFKKLIDEELN